jgi:stringent starvation protein B
MNSSRPYLLRAFYEWIVDNNCTPYIVVNADAPGTDVPREYVEDGRIVLNVAPGAVRSLLMQNDHLEFQARFSGVPFSIYAPMRAVTAIYAKENGRGMVFKEDEDDHPPEEAAGGAEGGSSVQTKAAASKGKKGRPKLTIVK